MPQVSRRPLSRNTEKQIFSIFFQSLAKLSNPDDIQKFLFDLLGPVERTMLAKRLAIAMLLAKGYRYEAIKDMLKVSQETIARVNISLNYSGQGYNIVIKKALRDEKWEDIAGKIDDFLVSVLPRSSVKRALELSRKESRKKPKRTIGV